VNKLSVIYFLLVITLVVVVHEFGHFIFAKLFNTYVIEFAIGFGPTIFSKKGKETTFKFNLIPLGGYVRLAGEDEMNSSENTAISSEKLLYNKKPIQKFLISFAGPFFSILLGYVLLAFNGLYYGFQEVKIESVIQDSPAYYAGLKDGDVIKKVNGNYAFDSSILSLAINGGKKVDLEIIRNGENINTEVTPELTPKEFTVLFSSENIPENSVIKTFNKTENTESVLQNLVSGDPLIIETDKGNITGNLINSSVTEERKTIGIYYALFTNEIVRDIFPFEKGDKIKSINGMEINTGNDLINAVQTISLEKNNYIMTISENKIKNIISYSDVPFSVKIIRNSSEEILDISKENFIKVIGEPNVIKQAGNKWKPGIGESFITSVQWANTLLKSMLQAIVQLFSGAASSKDVMGPVGIADLAGKAAKSGLETFINFIALITLNLGIFNLLPLPALDGGRIVFSLYEMITRKRVNPKIEAIIHTVGFLLLMGLAVLITYQDILRIFGK